MTTLPTGDSSWVTWVWVTLLSTWGGVVSYIRKVREGVSRFNLQEMIGELVTSGFSGWMTYYLCDYFNTPDSLTAVFVGISGHMGTRAVYQLEQMLTKRINNGS